MKRHIALGVLAVLLCAAAPAMAQEGSAAKSRNSAPQTPGLEPGANSFVESQARELLEKAGYTNVSSLMNDKDGIWRGKAVKDKSVVAVGVDFHGHIAASKP